MKSEQRGKRIEEDAHLDLEKEKTHCERKEETARAAAATGDGRTRRRSRLLELHRRHSRLLAKRLSVN